MSQYLKYKFKDTNAFISTYDELPLWSASFGLLLFKYLEIHSAITIVDIGSGTGFPLLELAARFGASSKVFGIDCWANANKRARQKLKNYKIKNVEILDASAEKLPLPNNSVDLIVSNLGINNFANPAVVFNECNRVLKPGSKLVITTNLNGHWKQFYQIFINTLAELGKNNIIGDIKTQEEHRGTVKSVSKLFMESGFEVNRYFEDSFEMKFLNGTAFLNHYFVKLGWLSSWIDLLPKKDLKPVFALLEEDLNRYSIQNSGLALTVPMLYIEGRKISI